MNPPPNQITTKRLTLRRWRDEDRATFAALNADPEVMRNFPAPLNRTESDAFVDRIEASFVEPGCRDRVAAGGNELGPGLRTRGSPGGAGRRLRSSWSR